MSLELSEIFFIVSLSFFAGGILKGATGIGSPIIAVPILAIYFDARFAIIIFSIPNIIPNIWQAWTYRKTALDKQFMFRFAGAGALGALFGTSILALFSSDRLTLAVAAAVVLYVIFRFARPKWRLSINTAYKIAIPVGFLGGAMQTAAGLSAPISVTFLNSLNLTRETFAPTISFFFIGVGITQIPMLLIYGMLTTEMVILSLLALFPLIAGMPVGSALAKKLSPKAFDRSILIILSILSAKLFIQSF